MGGRNAGCCQGEGILIKPITPLQELAGIDAGNALTEMKKLDAMRTLDRC